MEQKVIGKNIAKFRTERGLTQSQLAEFLFITPQTVSKWETENGTPDISLLPKIALFLDVTIDDLFGISNLDHVEDLVLRYSVIREENLYHEAMRALENKLNTLSSEETEQEYYKLQGLKTHLFVQNSREKIKQGIKLSQEMLDKIGGNYNHEWYLPFKLQLTLFEKMDGEVGKICRENKELFEREPNEITLRVACETYMMLERYEEVLELLSNNEKAQELLQEVTPNNKATYITKLSAAAKLEDTGLAEEIATQLLKDCNTQDEFEIQWILMSLYKDTGNKTAFEKTKEKVLSIIDRIDEKEYIKEMYRKQFTEEFA